MSSYSIRCPVCRKKFPWNPTAGWPEFCPNSECESRIAHDRADDDIVIPFVRTNSKMKAIDSVYRDMEAGSIHRAQLAANMLDVPESEMSALKITDLKDNQRPGDTAVVMPPNPVSDLMKQFPQHTGFNNPNGVEYSAPVQTGPSPNAGAKFRTILQNQHGEKYGGHTVSDRPTNEVLQPGYRRRG